MKLLSIALPWHDGNISYFDGTTVKYLKLERSEQKKRYYDNNLWNWTHHIKEQWNIEPKDVDHIAIISDIYDENLYTKEMKEVSYNNTALLKLIKKEEHPVGRYVDKDIWHINHHYAHAKSAWMMTDKETISIVIDGAADDKHWMVFKGDTIVDYGTTDDGSIGWGMRESGKILGVSAGHFNDIAGKVMGLQSYGKVDDNFLNYLRRYDIRNISKVIFNKEEWNRYKGDNLVADLTKLDWIKTVHVRVGEIIVELFKTHANPEDVIVYSGGVAQNVIWNTQIKNSFKNVVIPPHSSDEGLSLGGLEILRKQYNLPRFKLTGFPYVQNDVKPNSEPSVTTLSLAAKFLAEGKIIAWYQGNGEVGPRALGNRSILMDPRILDGKMKVNAIKKRENYRPFGASVLKEYAKTYFDNNFDDNYMIYTCNVNDYKLPAITHVDGTCRVQTVTEENGVFQKLLQEFFNITGCPVLLNTSLNLAGYPLAAYPDNAKDLFYNTPIDCVFIGDELLSKCSLNELPVGVKRI